MNAPETQAVKQMLLDALRQSSMSDSAYISDTPDCYDVDDDECERPYHSVGIDGIFYLDKLSLTVEEWFAAKHAAENDALKWDLAETERMVRSWEDWDQRLKAEHPEIFGDAPADSQPEASPASASYIDAAKAMLNRALMEDQWNRDPHRDPFDEEGNDLDWATFANTVVAWFGEHPVPAFSSEVSLNAEHIYFGEPSPAPSPAQPSSPQAGDPRTYIVSRDLPKAAGRARIYTGDIAYDGPLAPPCEGCTKSWAAGQATGCACQTRAVDRWNAIPWPDAPGATVAPEPSDEWWERHVDSKGVVSRRPTAKMWKRMQDAGEEAPPRGRIEHNFVPLVDSPTLREFANPETPVFRFPDPFTPEEPAEIDRFHAEYDRAAKPWWKRLFKRGPNGDAR